MARSAVRAPELEEWSESATILVNEEPLRMSLARSERSEMGSDRGSRAEGRLGGGKMCLYNQGIEVGIAGVVEKLQAGAQAQRMKIREATCEVSRKGGKAKGEGASKRLRHAAPHLDSCVLTASSGRLRRDSRRPCHGRPSSAASPSPLIV